LSKESQTSTGTPSASTQEEYPKYDLVAGYYIVMGGFVAPCNTESDGYGYPTPDISGKQFRTLGPDAVKALAKEGHFLQVQTRTVQDKSKADILAKGLVCFQVFWMLVEASDTGLSPINHLYVTDLSHRV
jgi:hypothetical protein